MAKATLINQAGQKQVVDVGSQQAQQLFGQGYSLMGSAPVVPQGATKISGPSGLQGLNESQIFRQGQDIYRLPSINTTLDAEQVSPDVPEPEAVNDVSFYTAGLDTTIKGLEENIKNINEPLPQEQEISEIRKRQGELSEEKAKVQETALPKAEEFGYTQYTKELQALMPQIARLEADFNKIAEENQNRPISSRIIGGTQDRLQRQKAIELAGLSAIAQAYQGNIQLATQTAKDMVEMELAPIQTRIDDQKWQIEQVYEQLTSAEQKKADSLNLVLDERNRLLEEEKERKMNIANVGLVAAQNGADQATIEKIMNAKTYGEAIINSGQYLKTETGNVWDTYVDEKTGETRLINKKTGEVVNPGQSDVANGILVDGSGQAYDIASYATDPNHEINVQNALNKIGKFYTIEDIDAYIKGESPESPITGEMIANASEKYGVSWEMMAAIIKADSNFADPRMNDQGQISDKGARQRAYRTMNPGNVGNVDSGANVQMNSWQDGVDAVAKNLAWRKTTVQPKSGGGGSPESPESIDDVDYVLNDVIDANISMTPSQFKISLEKEVSAGNLNLSKTQITDLVSAFKEKQAGNKTPVEKNADKQTALTADQKKDVAIGLLKATKMDKETAKKNLEKGYITSGGKNIYLSQDTINEINTMIDSAKKNWLGQIKIK